MFTREDGQPICFSSFNRQLRMMCERAGLPRVTPHELRHSSASLLLAQGVDQRIIMEVLRHSTIGLTADLYTHVVSAQLRDALDRLDAALG